MKEAPRNDDRKEQNIERSDVGDEERKVLSFQKWINYAFLENTDEED